MTRKIKDEGTAPIDIIAGKKVSCYVCRKPITKKTPWVAIVRDEESPLEYVHRKCLKSTKMTHDELTKGELEEEFKTHFLANCKKMGIEPGRVEFIPEKDHYHDAPASIEEEAPGHWIIYLGPSLTKDMIPHVAAHEACHIATYPYREATATVMKGLVDTIQELLYGYEETIVDNLAKAICNVKQGDRND
jgi:ribulose-5-phosphate 4-epimerase/fuculose-1-phosphate aldolase